MLKWIRQPDLHRSRVITNDVRRSLRFGGIKLVGPAGNAPAVSSPPDWRIAFFLWPAGGAPRTRTG
jgi:hypothetical protein